MPPKNNHQQSLYLPDDPNKDVPLRDLLKKHGGFTAVVEEKEWFDGDAKPRRKPSDSDFEPDPNIKDDDADVSISE